MEKLIKILVQKEFAKKRKKKSLTQESVAKRANVSRSTIARIENDIEKVSMETLVKAVLSLYC